MKVPNSPKELGLPSKFVDWRPYQKEVVERLFSSKKKYFICEMPTGAGKSLIGLAASGAVAGKTYYVVNTKQLQEQIVTDFPYVKTVKGRSNFPCLVKSGVTADKCVYAMLKKKCPVKDNCPYLVQRRIAKEAKVSIHNYAYYLAVMNFVRDWEQADLLVLDEAHLIDGEILRFIELVLTFNDIHHTVGIPFPGSELKSRIMDCVNKCDERLEDNISKLKARYSFDLLSENYDAIPERDLEEIRRMESLHKKVRFLLKVYDDTWIIDYIRKEDWSDSKIVFRPVWVNNFSNYMFNHGSKVLMMSATIGNIDIYCRSLGLDVKEVDYMTLPSSFPREVRPFVYAPIGRFSQKYYEETRDSLIDFIDSVIEKHHDEKGVIHTVNYRIMSDVIDRSSYVDRFIYHDDANGREKALSDFKESEHPFILISPSMHTGVDLPGDEARWQVLCKIPFAYLGDKQISKRLEQSPEWYRQDAVNRIVQTAGRIVRSKDDYGITYMPDANFKWFVANNKELFPDWFLDAVAVEKE